MLNPLLIPSGCCDGCSRSTFMQPSATNGKVAVNVSSSGYTAFATFCSTMRRFAKDGFSDLKSADPRGLWGFKYPPGHHRDSSLTSASQP
jgi:hypothetical protein